MNLITNKKLTLTHKVERELTAGIELFGYEVKSLRLRLGSLEGSRVIIRGGEAFLIGAYIPPYQVANVPKGYDPYRTRRLLFTKKELLELHGIEQAKNLTLIPISLYLTKNLIKCTVGLCKKKQAHDKREVLKKEIAQRELRSRM